MSKQSRAGTCSHCDSPILARRLCRKHYQRWAKWGDPLKTVNLLTESTPAERLTFYGWTVTDTGCWEWDGNRFPKGYGRVPMNGTTRGAHCVAFEVWKGPIPEGMLIRHTCDNPPCINPDHLLTGTNQDNADDMVERNRQARLPGELSSQAQLTNEVVIEMRRLYREGLTQQMIAKQFGVSSKNVHMIVNNRTWKHLLDKEVIDLESEGSHAEG